MSGSASRVLRGWKAWGCGLAIVGAALAGAPAGAATPTVPGAPTIGVATAGARTVKVAFTKPADNGGAKVTNYRAKCVSIDGGVTRSHEGFKSPIFVAGLTAGKTYACNVAARNKVGLGAASELSNAVVVKATVPGAPTINAVTARAGGIVIAFAKPADNGGAKITDYRAKCTSSDGGAKGARAGSKSPITVNGLSRGKTYTCTVAARNRIGLGTASAPSDPIATNSH
jgi:hypothetical protein